MKKKIIKGLVIISIVVSCFMSTFAVEGVKVNTGKPDAGYYDNTIELAMQDIAEGRRTNEFLYKNIVAAQGGYSPTAVAKILDNGYLLDYAEQLKAGGFLASDYVVKGTNKKPVTSNQTANQYSAVFDANYYLKRYPELAKTVGTDPTKLLNHFLTVGVNEYRQGNEEFNVIVYAQSNPDLYAAYGTNGPMYYQHYIDHGKAEGRKAH